MPARRLTCAELPSLGRFFIVTEACSKPALDSWQWHLLAARIVFGLVAADFPDCKVSRIRMRKIPATHGRRGSHCVGIRKRDPGSALHVQQAPQRRLLGVIGAGRIARSRANAPILLLDERIAGQRLLRRKSPVSTSNRGVQVFCGGLGESIGQRLQEYRTVVIVGALEGGRPAFDAHARRNGKRADVVAYATVFRRNEVGEAQMRLTWRFATLLAQVVEQCDLPALIVWRIDGDVVVGD